MSDVVLAIASELSVEPVLRKLVDAARELVGARYAAIGVPDEDGDGFAQFLTSGLADEQITAIGPLPRQHGLLGAMRTDAKPYRTDNVTADPRFWGWPPAHPDMRSLLGVPIVARGDIVGLFYLTDKEPGFSDEDQRLIELLAAHAAIAIENARLFELTRELSVAQERTRLAHELHDAMNQTLFSPALVAETAAGAVRPDPAQAEHELQTVKALARSALAELRTAIHGLRPGAGGGRARHRARSPLWRCCAGRTPRRDPAGLRRPAERSGPRARGLSRGPEGARQRAPPRAGDDGGGRGHARRTSAGPGRARRRGGVRPRRPVGAGTPSGPQRVVENAVLLP